MKQERKKRPTSQRRWGRFTVTVVHFINLQWIVHMSVHSTLKMSVAATRGRNKLNKAQSWGSQCHWPPNHREKKRVSDTDINKRQRSVAAQWKGEAIKTKERNITQQAGEPFSYSCAQSTRLFTVHSSDYDKTSNPPHKKIWKQQNQNKSKRKSQGLV